MKIKNGIKTIPIVCLLLFTSISVYGQGLTIGTGTTTLTLGSSTTFSLSGNWTDNGTFTAGTGSTVIFNGASGNQTITGTETFNNLTINKAAGNVVLANNINVNGTLTCTSGNLDVNNYNCSLGASATLSETSSNEVMNGTISIDKKLNAPSSFNAGNLGAEITSTADLGTTTITRGSAVQTANGNNSIRRYFDITPTTNTGLNATLVFHYYTSELLGLTESTLSLFKSTDGGTTWTNEGGTVNTTAHTVTLSGIASFSRWTVGSTTSPLPVELTSFSASVNENTVKLNWQTATEVNNYGFEIQRALSSTTPGQDEWEKIGFVNGAGNSNSPKYYTFSDKNAMGGSSFDYRLKQIDVDGKYKYSDVVNVKITPGKFSLNQNYPNPFNPSTAIKYEIPAFVGDAKFASPTNVTLKVYDVLGREVATLVNKEQSVGNYRVTFDASTFASGVYFYRIIAGSFVQTKKMLLLK